MKQTRKINYKLLNIIIDITIEMCHKNLPQNISHQRAKIIETQIIKYVNLKISKVTIAGQFKKYIQ